MMQGMKYRYSALYAEFTETPELAKFRRYLELWPWMLNNQIADIEKLHQECNNIVADVHGIARDPNLVAVTDYHRAYVDEENPLLKKKVTKLERMVRRYSKDALLAHGLANMPAQPQIFARHFAEHKDIFEDDVYGPTKEHVGMYSQVPPHPDTFSLKGSEEEDHATKFVLRHLKSMNRMNGRLRDSIAWVRGKPVQEESMLPQYIDLDTVRTTMNWLAAVYVPVLLAGSLVVLSCVRAEKMRIVVLGVFACVLTASLVWIMPGLKRSDLFAITAAYSAVGGIYIGGVKRC